MGKAVVALLSANGLGNDRGSIAMAGIDVPQSQVIIESMAVNGRRKQP
jgi:hypothetical protein